MSSIEPNDGCDEVDCGEEVLFGFVVSCGDGSELLEATEEILDKVAFLVEVQIDLSHLAPVGHGRDDGGYAGCGKRIEHSFVGIEDPVSDQYAGFQVGQKVIGPFQVVSLAGGDQETGGIAQRVGAGVDLGAQPTTRAADGLIVAPFLRAPALC